MLVVNSDVVEADILPFSALAWVFPLDRVCRGDQNVRLHTQPQKKKKKKKNSSLPPVRASLGWPIQMLLATQHATRIHKLVVDQARTLRYIPQKAK